jgi:hypothetical protein
MTDELTLEKWDRMPARERRSYATRLARELPDGFAFRAIEAHSLGDQAHHMAVYSFQDAEFVLVPGGEVTLGYDPNRPWEPTPEEQESWRHTKEEYGIRGTIHKHIARVTRRPKTIQLKPLLMETTAGEMGWEPIPADDPEVKEIVREHLRGKSSSDQTVTVFSGEAGVRVRRLEDGGIRAERAEERTHVELVDWLAKTGFRFPTSDEWEYACGAGAATLFRWGDHAPCDRYPTDISPAEAEWRRRWALSGGKLKYPREGFVSDWDLHCRPNAFGLFIASNPYKSELVAEPGITRGGDGGCTICGGAGFFVGWLTLATAYFEKEACRHDPDEPIEMDFMIGRRVLPLG